MSDSFEEMDGHEDGEEQEVRRRSADRDLGRGERLLDGTWDGERLLDGPTMFCNLT